MVSPYIIYHSNKDGVWFRSSKPKFSSKSNKLEQLQSMHTLHNTPVASPSGCMQNSHYTSLEFRCDECSDEPLYGFSPNYFSLDGIQQIIRNDMKYALNCCAILEVER